MRGRLSVFHVCDPERAGDGFRKLAKSQQDHIRGHASDHGGGESLDGGGDLSAEKQHPDDGDGGDQDGQAFQERQGHQEKIADYGDS